MNISLFYQFVFFGIGIEELKFTGKQAIEAIEKTLHPGHNKFLLIFIDRKNKSYLLGPDAFPGRIISFRENRRKIGRTGCTQINKQVFNVETQIQEFRKDQDFIQGYFQNTLCQINQTVQAIIKLNGRLNPLARFKSKTEFDGKHRKWNDQWLAFIFIANDDVFLRRILSQFLGCDNTFSAQFEKYLGSTVRPQKREENIDMGRETFSIMHTDRT